MTNDRFNAWLFLAPALFIYGVFGFYPIIQTIWLSLHEQTGVGAEPIFVGLGNYIELTQDDFFLQALRNTAIWMVAFLIGPPLVALALALALSANTIVNNLCKTVLFLPIALSSAVVGIIWGWVYQPNIGLLDQVLTMVGLSELSRAWLGPHFALASVIVAASWPQTAFAMIIFLAGLSGVPKDVIEAAKIDGAGPFRLFWRVTLPLLRPATTIVIASSMINALQSTEIVLTMTRGGPFGTTDVIGYRMYTETFWNYEFGYGASMGVVIALLTAVFAIPYIRRMTLAQERQAE